VAACLRLLAAIPILTGAAVVVFGARIIPGADGSASLASELRFFAVWWIGAGLFLAWVAADAVGRRRELSAFCGLLFLGGVARAIAYASEGRPATLFVVLMAIELVLPLVLLGALRRARRGAAYL